MKRAYQYAGYCVALVALLACMFTFLPASKAPSDLPKTATSAGLVRELNAVALDLSGERAELRFPNLERLKSVYLHNDGLRQVSDVTSKLPVRLAALKAISNTPYDEVLAEEIAAYLTSPMPEGAAAIERERAVRNDLLNLARKMAVGEEKMLVAVLVEQAASTEQDIGLRDYALQHLAAWAPKLPEAELSAAVFALHQALGFREGTLAGTALLGLGDLDSRAIVSGRGVDLSAASIAIALDDGFSIESRMTALLVCTEKGIKHGRLSRMAASWDRQTDLAHGARLVARNYLKSNL